MNTNICPKCGLPEGICICEKIAKDSQEINVRLDRKKYGKMITIIEGFGKGIDVKSISKKLKNSLACGGTYKKKEIELQGDHQKKIKKLLVSVGFEEDSIKIQKWKTKTEK